ncbi:MAG: PSD1 domain-containing protein [Verrucomicrobiae bacterium]|nr:PSD1 domain-containing protein [Verrucomicrobiae bacterium]
MWKKLGPWAARPEKGKLTISARGASHGAANLSGVEIWRGESAPPDADRPSFVSELNPEQTAFFEKKIRPILVEHCYECHSAKSEKLKGGFLVDSRAGVMKGGDTGPVVTPGDPEASLLIAAVRHLNEDTAMPPKEKLPAHVIADLETWVRMGAPDPRTENTVATVAAKSAIDWDKAREWWSFRPLVMPPLPEVRAKEWPINAIDHFILAGIEAAQLKPSPDAEARAFIRRATYDLTGLPPTPEEVGDFLAEIQTTEGAESAYEKLIDRLLDSPRYGERWGRHWLDVVRYADTAGDNSDYPIPQMQRYRDWVIDAFNRDLPYDQFVREQLAGDLLPDATPDQIIATGYVANARRFGSRVDDYPQHLTIEDTLDNLGRTFLGLTLSCSRCHDHKFDPITNQDYYALYGIFQSTRYPWPGIELDKRQRDLAPLVPVAQRADAEKKTRDREAEQGILKKEFEKLAGEVKKASGGKKQALEKQLAQTRKRIEELEKNPLSFELAYALSDSDSIGDAVLQQKGDPARPGPVVPRRFLTLFGGQELPESSSGSGRAELADWILSADNPLPARVMANRIWLHHFGKGLVPTPNDFGKQGKPVTHPELLDYLASQFRDSGWSMKQMHRHIMLSRTYRQGSLRDDAAREIDPANEKLASFPRLRLDAESIRDTLLQLGGNLDLSKAGPHPFPPQSQWNFTQHKPFKEVYDSNHRSVYLMTQRIQRHPYLAIFDGADPSTSTPSRTTSTTPLQALYLLNDVFVHGQSGRVAERLLSLEGDELSRMQFAHELLYARPAADEELTAAETFLANVRVQLREDGVAESDLETEAWRAYVRVLFRLNEFVYLD